MKKLTSIILILFLSLLSSPSSSESFDDLVERDGLYYKKFTQVPFTGDITGQSQGSFKDGKAIGEWVGYWSNGQLEYKGKYKDGWEEGEWVGYHDNGQLERKGKYKDGKKVGEWISYDKDGTQQ